MTDSMTLSAGTVAEGAIARDRQMRTPIQIERICDPDPETFRREYLEKGRPVIVKLTPQARPKQYDWSFDYLVKKAGNEDVPVYDWGDKGPTIDDEFTITRMNFTEAIGHARATTSTQGQRFAICQLPVETIAPIGAEYEPPGFLSKSGNDRLPFFMSDGPRNAMFLSYFRGIHWHNGREAVAQIIEGRKRFILYSPKDTRYLYPRGFWRSPISWFDETEAVFCSDIPFEKGLENIDLKKFPAYRNASPYVADLEGGEALFIPSHWWHFTTASAPSIVVVRFWDSPLRRWAPALFWRSLLMRPYRKYLFRRLRKWKALSRTKTGVSAPRVNM